VPTDPYVAPDLDDRPRQQQNLPPGVAYPPAGHWVATRPGDLGAGQPRGRMLGSPGPNIGYAYTLTERMRDRLRLGPHEHADDAVAVVAEIAAKRAASFGRAPVIADVDVAIKLLGYDGEVDPEFVEVRSTLVHEAHHSYSARRALVDTVPEELVRMRPADLGVHVADWRRSARSYVEAHRQAPSAG